MANQTHAESSEAQSFPFFPLIFKLNHNRFTFCEQFVNIIYKFEAVYNVVPNYEMDPQTVNPILFDCKSTDFLWIVIFKIENDISLWAVFADDLNFDNFDFSRLLILQLFLFDVPEQTLFIGFQ